MRRTNIRGQAGCESIPLKHRRSDPLREKIKQVTTLDSLLKILHIKHWDYCIVGDGSGTTWAYECGWASTLIARKSDERKVFHGGMSCGTNITSEMMAWLHPLLYLAQQNLKLGTRVHILTDCQLLAEQQQGRFSRRKQAELWFLADSFQRRGILLHIHWIPRDVIRLNQLAHELANSARKSQQQLIPTVLSKLTVDSASELNPRAKRAK